MTVHSDVINGGWDFAIAGGHATSGDVLEAFAVQGGRRVTLGKRTVSATETHPTRGCVDSPVDGQIVKGPALLVAGWVMFGDVETDLVEVFIDDRLARRARRCDPRPDLAIGSSEPVLAITSGFSDLIPLPVSMTDRTCVIRVRVRAEDQRIWTSPAVTVHVPASQESPRPNLPSLVPDRSLIADRPVSVHNADRPRVCVFTHSLGLGGGELYIQELVLRLNRSKAAHILVVSPTDGPVRRELEREGVSVHITAGYSTDPTHYRGRTAELISLLHTWRTDVALINTLGIFPAADAANQAGVPVIWAIHESFDLQVFNFLNWGSPGLCHELYDRWTHSLMNAELIFEAEATLRMHAANLPGIRGRCIRYGIDLGAIDNYRHEHDRHEVRALLGFDADDMVMLCMGVIQERKSQLALVMAFVGVTGAFPKAKLVLVGDHRTSYSRSVHECIDRLGVADAIKVMDIDSDTYRWYLAADVLISASDTESMPRSILEAMAFGVPTVAADVFGVGEVITDGETGCLFVQRSGLALKAALRRILSMTEDEISAMSACCIATSRSYSGAGYAREYATLISDLARHGAPSDDAGAASNLESQLG